MTGWSSDFAPGDRLVIEQDETELQTITVPVSRPDVAGQHGQGAEDWGFRAYGIAQDGRLKASRINLRFANGHRLHVADTRPVGSDHACLLFEDFVNEVNHKGGTIVELGSRARSGTTIRERFTSNVNYIGVDISAGANVDIIGDAHRLSELVRRPVDYVVSISTFEHLMMPWKVALEINAILRHGGKVFSHSHQTWPGHEEPWDYFRFSREAWAALFNKHTGFSVRDARRGEPLSAVSHYNYGGAFEDMEHSPGYGISVCVAEKIAEPLVRWDADVADIQAMEYKW